MLPDITSIYLTDTLIHILFRSRKSQIVKENTEGKLYIIGGDPLLSDFLNTAKNGREYMTPKIAAQLKLRFQYHLHPSQRAGSENNAPIDFDFMFRTVLYLYALTSIDLSYLCADAQTAPSEAESRGKQLTAIMDAVISGFDKKTHLTYDELVHIVLSSIMGTPWNQYSVLPPLHKITWMNMQHQYYTVYENRHIESMLGNEEHVPLTELPVLHMPDFDPRSSFVCSIKLNIQKAHEQLHLVGDILSSDSIEALQQLHPELHNQIHDRYTDIYAAQPEHKSWKYRLLEHKLICQQFRSRIAFPYSWIGHCDCYAWRYRQLSGLRTDLNNLQKRCSTECADAGTLLDKMKGALEEQMNLLWIQMQLYLDCGAFGLWYPKVNVPRVHTPKEFVHSMVDFLFNGNSNHIGSIDIDTGLYVEINQTITNYLSDKKTYLNENRIEGLCHRVRFYLYPDKRSTANKESLTTPLRFSEQLWQLYEYCFGLDFFMLRSGRADNSKDSKKKIEDWDTLVSLTLHHFLNGKDKNSLDTLCSKLRYFLQKKCEEYNVSYAHSFSKEELWHMRYMNALAEHTFEETASQITGIPDPDIEPTDIAVIKLRKMISRQMEQLEQTVSIIDDLLKADDILTFMKLRHLADHIPTKKGTRLLSDEPDWKQQVFNQWMDLSTGKYMCMSITELETFLKTLGACCAGNHVYDGNLDLQDYKEKLAVLFTKIVDLKTNYSDSEQHFWDTGILQQFYDGIKLANQYLVYFDWVKHSVKWRQ